MRNALQKLGLNNLGQVYDNLTTEILYEEIIQREEAHLSKDKAVVAETGEYTGRSPNDKFIVREPSTEGDVDWGAVNKTFDAAHFDDLFDRVAAYLANRDVFVQDLHAGADAEFRLPIRVVTELAWHSLFARNMFIRESDPAKLASFEPSWHLLYAPGFQAEPERDHTRSEVFIIIHFARKLILIGGTRYAGELKKSVFTLLNYLLPQQNVMSMHCSANKNDDGDTALFFGLSGTGKTTLSASADYELIGDDEHGWTDRGVFNFEGGCYAKVIKLSAEAEPEIYAASKQFGTVLENVVIDPVTGEVDLDDDSLTENTRASYPLDSIPNASLDGLGGHPTNIIMLTCDAFGVMPPVAKLTPDQAMYHFVSGYTAKVAGTERGVSEPTATFSPCFGAPFMVLPPLWYARLLGEKIRLHNSHCWLVNTGWSGGPYGEGERISIGHTRAIVSAILGGQLAEVAYRRDPVFGLDIPTTCPGVPEDLLTPRATWRDPSAYDIKARDLVRRFGEHFATYAEAAPELSAAAPPL
jgi:phosphoenolpyruvate carboxykinase (ATP)